MIAVLDFLADNPDGWIGSEELATGIGRTLPQLTGVHGAFGYRWISRHELEQQHWFFGAYGKGPGGTMEYRVAKLVADLIRALRS
ncbi:MAG: hypothetical protein ACC726_09790 [Chloroflexota bacterium]